MKRKIRNLLPTGLQQINGQTSEHSTSKRNPPQKVFWRLVSSWRVHSLLTLTTVNEVYSKFHLSNRWEILELRTPVRLRAASETSRNPTEKLPAARIQRTGHSWTRAKVKSR